MPPTLPAAFEEEITGREFGWNAGDPKTRVGHNSRVSAPSPKSKAPHMKGAPSPSPTPSGAAPQQESSLKMTTLRNPGFKKLESSSVSSDQRVLIFEKYNNRFTCDPSPPIRSSVLPRSRPSTTPKSPRGAPLSAPPAPGSWHL